LWLGLVLIVVPSLALVALEIAQSASLAPLLRARQRTVVHGLQVVDAARAFDQAIQDAERGQRGFVITGDESYLGPYETGIREAPERLGELRQLTADNGEQQNRLAKIDRQLGIKLGELKRTIDARRSVGSFTAAQQIVETGIGRDAMTAIERGIGGVIAAEDELLLQGQVSVAAAERTAARLRFAAAVLTVMIIALGLFVLVLAVRRAEAAQRSQREGEERFRLLVEGVRDYAIYMLDSVGRVLSWNAGAERIKGYKANEIVGRHFSAFYTPEARAAGEPERVLAAAAAQGAFRSEDWRVRKDGSRLWASIVLTALHNADGSLRGFAKVTHDLTAQRQQEEVLERSREALLQAQKMEAVGHLTGGVAHDFNNLLTVIIGNLDMLAQQAQQEQRDARSTRLVASALRAAEQGAALTGRLLAFSRRQALAPRTIDINGLVGATSDLLRRSLGEHIRLEAVLAGGLWSVRIDPSEFQSALVNLALNARDAMPGGGKLTIETGNAYLDEAYAAVHAEVTSGQYVLLSVTDTGTGMTDEAIERAFEPFFTTKPEGEGTGLGLSQVYGFIKQSGGHVKLYSERGEGTTVKVYLPRYVGPAAPETTLPERPAAAAVTQSSHAVLLVEDDPNVREFSANALEHLGYRVHEAADAAAALDLLAQHPEVRLLFTDVGLPGLNGRQLAEEAMRRAPNLKILFTTGYARNAIVHHGILDYGVELLAKPFTVASLGQKLSAMLREDR
jgi:PAS domain S-box-containing protein